MMKLNLDWLRQKRVDSGLTLAQAGAAVGKSPAQIWKIENCKSKIFADDLFKLINIYGADIDDVIEIFYYKETI